MLSSLAVLLCAFAYAKADYFCAEEFKLCQPCEPNSNGRDRCSRFASVSYNSMRECVMSTPCKFGFYLPQDKKPSIPLSFRRRPVATKPNDADDHNRKVKKGKGKGKGKGKSGGNKRASTEDQENEVSERQEYEQPLFGEETTTAPPPPPLQEVGNRPRAEEIPEGGPRQPASTALNSIRTRYPYYCRDGHTCGPCDKENGECGDNVAYFETATDCVLSTTCSGAVGIPVTANPLPALTECQKRLDEATSGTPRIGQYLPRCVADGHFALLQCHTSTGHCWCVDPVSGAEVDGTRVGPGIELPKCGSDCEALYERTMTSSVGDLAGRYIPACTLEGIFAPVQCLVSTGECWCVDPQGNEISGTRKNAIDGGPDCAVPTA